MVYGLRFRLCSLKWGALSRGGVCEASQRWVAQGLEQGGPDLLTRRIRCRRHGDYAKRSSGQDKQSTQRQQRNHRVERNRHLFLIDPPQIHFNLKMAAKTSRRGLHCAKKRRDTLLTCIPDLPVLKTQIYLISSHNVNAF